MGFPGYAGWQVVIDDPRIASDRVPLDLNQGPVQIGGTSSGQGIDWGQSAITAFMSQQGQYGNSPADYIVPNRTITIPLGVGATLDGADPEHALRQLSEKVGLLQREGGWLSRQRAGGEPMYADIINATLQVPDVWLETAGVEPGVSLVLECLPDFYGDEITFDAISCTGFCTGVATNGTANWVPDPSFEYDAVGASPPGYVVQHGTLAVSSAWAASGSKSALATLTSSASAQYPNVALSSGVAASSGQAWTFSVQANVLTNTAPSGFYLQIAFATGSGAQYSTSSMVTSTGTGMYSVSAVAPPGTTMATPSIAFLSTASGQIVKTYLDNVLFGTGSTYADGDMSGYEWSGTPGDSATLTDASIPGDYPARCRIQVTDTSGNNQDGLYWGLRSRYYDSSRTAQLAYQAQELTTLNGAYVTGLVGAQSSKVVRLDAPAANTWIPMLATTLSSGGALTHLGTYRMVVRAYSATELPQLRLSWGSVDLATPTVNAAASLYVQNGFNLVDLGVVRLDQPPVGSARWLGVISAQVGTASDDAQIDEVFLIPMGENAGTLTYSPASSSSVVSVDEVPTTVASVTGIGTVDWTQSGTKWQVTLGPGATASHYLKETGCTFDVPSGATIAGIAVAITVGGGAWGLQATQVSIVKGGAIGSTNRATHLDWPSAGTVTYGGSTDLWGESWTLADVNASTFGVACAVALVAGYSATPFVSSVSITVYYTLGSGLTLSQDAVVYASQTCEMRTDGMYRTGDGTTYAAVSTVVGDLPRLAASGMESRPVQIFVKPSRGDLSTTADSGIDTFTVTPIVRPCYITRI